MRNMLSLRFHLRTMCDSPAETSCWSAALPGFVKADPDQQSKQAKGAAKQVRSGRQQCLTYQGDIPIARDLCGREAQGQASIL
jgi:hypothetical protein